MSAPQATIYRPPFPPHAENAAGELEVPPKAPGFWYRALVKAGIMANTSNEFPRINPTVVALLALLLPAVLALIAGGVYIGRQSATIERLDTQVGVLQKAETDRKLVELQQKFDDAKYLEGRLSQFKEELDQRYPGGKK